MQTTTNETYLANSPATTRYEVGLLDRSLEHVICKNYPIKGDFKQIHTYNLANRLS